MRNLKLFDDAVAFTSRFVPGDFLREPRTVQEKLAWLKVFDDDPLKTRCSDKLAVRGYVEEKLGFDASVPVLGVWDDPDDIDFDALPDRFVLKCNHGSGWNVVVTDKAELDREETKRKLRGWLETDYVLRGYELCYSGIPRKCFAEQYLGDGVSDLKDYKFICFNGVPEYCQVISDRSNERKRLNYYDMDFRFVDFCRLEFPNNAALPDEKPAGFETMKEFARILSADFKCVRVDFFEFGGRVYVGELTFIPGNGRMKYRDDPETGLFLGSKLRIYGEPVPLPPTERIPESGPRPDVTVVVPVYNGKEFVRDCVACLKAQTNANAEFVVVDDKSSDGSAEAFEEATRGDARFRILRHEKRTDLFHARRTGVLAARGRYVMFLDVDDLLVPDACKTVVETLDESGADLFCYGTTVENIGETSEKDLADSQVYLDREPVHGLVSSAEECRASFFGPRAWSASAWNKALKTEIAKAVFESVRTERNLGCAQDFFQSVLVFLRIHSLWSDVSRKLYVYRMGRGVSRLPKGAVTREKFERILTAAQVEAELRDRLDADGTLPEGFRDFVVEDFSCRIRTNTLRALWSLPDELAPWGFDAALAAWGPRAFSSPAFDVGFLWNGLPAVRSASALRDGTDPGTRVGLYAGRRRLAEAFPPDLAEFLSRGGRSFVPVFEEAADLSGTPVGIPGAEPSETLPPAPVGVSPRNAIPRRDLRIEAWSRIVRQNNLDSVFFLAPPARFPAETLALRTLGVRVFIRPDGPAAFPEDRESDPGTTETERTFDTAAAASLANGLVSAGSGNGPFSFGEPSFPQHSPLLSALLLSSERDRENAKARLDRLAKSKNEAVAACNRTIKGRDRTIEAFRRTVEALKRTVEARDRTVEARDRTIRKLRSAAQSARDRIGRLSERNARAKDRMKLLVGRLSTLRKENRRLERSLTLRLARLPARLFRLLVLSGRRNGSGSSAPAQRT